jgi:hypothetical protein
MPFPNFSGQLILLQRLIAQRTESIQDASARDQCREDLPEQRRVPLQSFGAVVRVRYLP